MTGRISPLGGVLLLTLLTACVSPTRQQLWHEVHRTLHEDQPYTFMMTRKSVVFVNRRFQNIEVTNIGMNRAWEYYVPGPMQLHSGE